MSLDTCAALSLEVLTQAGALSGLAKPGNITHRSRNEATRMQGVQRFWQSLTFHPLHCAQSNADEAYGRSDSRQ